MAPKALRYYWEFGDGQFSYDPAPTHIYTMPGDYHAKLTAWFPDGSVETKTFLIYVYDFDYSGTNPNASITNVCYRLPTRSSEGYGASEYKDNENHGLDWIWPPALIQIGMCVDEQGREIALVLDAKTQREYQINDFEVWRDRSGTYEGAVIKSEVHQKAHMANEGEHISIRHVEHHLSLKSFDRREFQDIEGYGANGLPIDFRVDNQLFEDGEPFTPVVTAKDVPIRGDIVFQEKVEAGALQLRTILYGAPYWLTQVTPYYETVDKQSRPELRVMTEDGYQENMASLPLFHISRSFDPLLNLATGVVANGSFMTTITGPDGRDFSAVTFGVGDFAWDNIPAGTSLAGDFSVYVWVNNVFPAVLPIQIYAFQNLSVEIHQVGLTYQLLINIDGVIFTSDLAFSGTGWTMITVTREVLSLRVFENKALLNVFALAGVINVGTTLYFAPAGQLSLFDPCVVQRAIGLDDITYYYDNVIRGGGEVLRPF